ncbi:hypothetical protein AKJ38_02330 [candidate division MSBL1 archaeon SCGC-AAA259I14]|uniref:CCA-adding enzyme n=3 Tax=candidate division MSBL1 TaxID=215777 RepID=A0A133URV7_9EURY|nr:hypothetical protein AKJ38_02330 [candidate division MSBL1 archaeon SCGC-AAA259I14]
MEEILEKVLEKIKPKQAQREKMAKTRSKLIEKAENATSDYSLTIKPKIVGSAARNTWILEEGERDIDLFLLFPKDTSREKLEKIGLEVGRKISKGKGKEQYAEHPYIHTNIDGFDVDIVPCYDIEDPTNLRSAVDRSTHHQKYVKENLGLEKADQVLLLKKFLKGIGTYGSELRIHGFSGYLCELLIIHFGSFRKLIESAKNWGSSKVINPDDDRKKEELQKIFPNQPLIFIDPVDPSRNVAAAVSKKNYATFIRASQDFLRDPREVFFFPNDPPVSKEKLSKILKSRETSIFMISINITFDLVPDIVYPQLRKTEMKLKKDLERSDFRVLRTDIWSKNKKAIILVELEVSELPKAKKHSGPPLNVKPEPFIQKHLNSEKTLNGPFINEEGRLMFEIERPHKKAREVLANSLNSREGFGKHIKKSIKEEGYEISENSEIIETAAESNALKFLGNYLTRQLPWYR